MFSNFVVIFLLVFFKWKINTFILVFVNLLKYVLKCTIFIYLFYFSFIANNKKKYCNSFTYRLVDNNNSQWTTVFINY